MAADCTTERRRVKTEGTLRMTEGEAGAIRREGGQDGGSRDTTPQRTDAATSRPPASERDADEAQGPSDLPSTPTQPGGDVGAPGETQQRDGEVAEGGHDVRPRAGAHLRAIFVEGHVADPVEAIFDPPVATVERQQP